MDAFRASVSLTASCLLLLLFSKPPGPFPLIIQRVVRVGKDQMV